MKTNYMAAQQLHVSTRQEGHINMCNYNMANPVDIKGLLRCIETTIFSFRWIIIDIET